VRFLTDESVFNEAKFDLVALEARLLNVSRLLPQLKLHFRGRDLSRPTGCVGWVQELAPVVRETVLTARATVDAIDVEFALAWSPVLEEPLVRSFTNLIPTPDGGAHQRALLRALPMTTRDLDLRAVVRRGLTAIVHVRMLHPQFGGPTRSHLASAEAGPAVTTVVRDAVAKSPWFWDAIHSAVR
jgi:DNA gyrase subunit B